MTNQPPLSFIRRAAFTGLSCLVPALFCMLSPRLEAASPEQPSIWREVTGVVNNLATNPAQPGPPRFTHPNMPNCRTTRDGRVALVEVYMGFTLLQPEKMEQPFLLNPADSYTMASTNALARLPSPETQFTTTGERGGIGTIWDDPAKDNPKASGGKDVYDLELFVSVARPSASTTDGADIKESQFFVTPIRIEVTNPKKNNATITSVTRTGAPKAVAVPFYNCNRLLEPVIVGDGRLLVGRVGSSNRTWKVPPNTLGIPVGSTRTNGMDIVYSYYTAADGAEAADPTKWTELIPITFAPYDSRIIAAGFGFAKAPFRDSAGVAITPGEDLGGSYPWMDRDAKNLFFETTRDQLHFSNGTDYRSARYPQFRVPEEAADYAQGENTGPHQGISFIGLWSHGKTVQIDTRNNDMDYAIGGGGGVSSSPQQRMVHLYWPDSYPAPSLVSATPDNGWTIPKWTWANPNSLPNNTIITPANGWVRLGIGRAEGHVKDANNNILFSAMPVTVNNTNQVFTAGNPNGDVIDSLENTFNYRKNFRPISLRDVAWPMATGTQSDELSFDDYVDPDALIIAPMNGLTTWVDKNTSGTTNTGLNEFKHWSGWDEDTHVFDKPVLLQNAATAPDDRWHLPMYGEVLGGRLEPCAMGGVHGKGLWMSGTTGLEFTIPAQDNVLVNGIVVSKALTVDWYAGLFVDCRFPDDDIVRRLATFPDGSTISLLGHRQILYAKGTVILNRITLPANITDSGRFNDLVPGQAVPGQLIPGIGWAHLAFQIRAAGTQVDFYLNGLIYNRWQDRYAPLFQLTTGPLTLGRPRLSAVTGFRGWLDDFKVIAHAVDYETACNHANGTLIRITDAHIGGWDVNVANRYPAWTHTLITADLKSKGEADFLSTDPNPKYACYYDYSADNAVHWLNIPHGTVSLRQSIHFPEGPLFKNRPRPRSTQNQFCTSCHNNSAEGGLTLSALSLSSVFAPFDPRRQPLQPPPMLFGNVPKGMIDNTAQASAQPTVDTPLTAAGKNIDEWMLADFPGTTTINSWTVIDANTNRDLLTILPGEAVATLDPAILGSNNLNIRVDLDSAQGAVALQYDTEVANTPLSPPYTVFAAGRVLLPTTGTQTHTITAKPSLSTLTSTLRFKVAGGTARKIANYRADFRTHAPLPGWSYLWNEYGSVDTPPAGQTSAAVNYAPLAWYHGTTVAPIIVPRYTARGSAYPEAGTEGSYVSLHPTGGHPGPGTAQGSTTNRYAIAAYTAKFAGYYGVSDGFVTSSSAVGNGGDVKIIVEKLNTATPEPKDDTYTNAFTIGSYPGGGTRAFNLFNVGQLEAGDTIYVCVGPNGNSANDLFTMDFSIYFKENGNPF